MKVKRLCLLCLGLFLTACAHSHEKIPPNPDSKKKDAIETKRDPVENDKPKGPVCGDGKIESPEQCEPGRPLPHTCQSLGYAGGQLGCMKNCRYDQRKCVATPKKDWVDQRQWRRRGGRGSCPYVYLFDGESYRFLTDLSGSVLAKGMDFFQPEFYGPNIYKLDGFRPHQGRYKMKAREVIYEASYFDAATLLIVDAPAGVQVYNTWSFTSQLGHQAERRFMSLKNPRPPVRAVDSQGRDVREFLLRVDDKPLPVTEEGLSRVELDFGPLAHPEHAKLLISAWGHYADFRGKQKPPYAAGTVIETKDEQGRWQVRLMAGKAAGDTRSWVVDLGGLLKADDSRMRITMAHLPSVLDVLDAVAIDDSAPVPLKVTRLTPSKALLRDEGAATVRSPDLKKSISADDDHLKKIPDAIISGLYTKFGPVEELMAASDDRFVIMVHGDSLVLEFPAPKEREGMSRHVFLEADVFYSLKYHPFGQVTEDNQPLPFHGMSRYPYAPKDWPYAKDADYQSHMKRWQTRRVEAP